MEGHTICWMICDKTIQQYNCEQESRKVSVYKWDSAREEFLRVWKTSFFSLPKPSLIDNFPKRIRISYTPVSHADTGVRSDSAVWLSPVSRL